MFAILARYEFAPRYLHTNKQSQELNSNELATKRMFYIWLSRYTIPYLPCLFAHIFMLYT